MTESKTVVGSLVGLHARPAAVFVQEACKYRCRISVRLGEKKADGKSILQVLSLGARQGQEIFVCADGEGETDAVKNLVRLVSSPAWDEEPADSPLGYPYDGF